FRRSAFAPGYGLAEATLKVTAMRAGEGPLVSEIDGRALVACGRPILESKVAIVDPVSRAVLRDDSHGEIWVAGPSVATGYWRRPDESAETFSARTADGAGPFLRTGDLGVLRDGQLYVTGRAKDLIIIRGQNYYPQDLETTVEQSGAAVKPGSGAAFPTE